MGILQKRKEKTRQRILTNAKHLFLSQGFMKTTMQDVARDSELGVGTIYNYFPSKSELLIGIFTDEMMEAQFDLSVLINSDQKVVDKLKQVIDIYITQLFRHQRSLFRELMVVIFHRQEGHEELVKRITETDALFLQVLRNVIEHANQSKLDIKIWNTDAAIQVIHSILRSITIAYMTEDLLTIDDVKKSVHMQVDFLFK
jgi:AcrR family transcriptional regulator